MVNSPLIRPYFLGGSFGEGTLNSHEDKSDLNPSCWPMASSHPDLKDVFLGCGLGLPTKFLGDQMAKKLSC